MYQKMRLFAFFLLIIAFSLLKMVDIFIVSERCLTLREARIKCSGYNDLCVGLVFWVSMLGSRGSGVDVLETLPRWDKSPYSTT